MADQSDAQELVPWILTGVATIVGALTSALIYVARKVEYDNAIAIGKLEASNMVLVGEINTCKDDRAKLFAQCEVNAMEIRLLKDKLSLMDSGGTAHARQMEKPHEAT